jgi:hypothetical protein
MVMQTLSRRIGFRKVELIHEPHAQGPGETFYLQVCAKLAMVRIWPAQPCPRQSSCEYALEKMAGWMVVLRDSASCCRRRSMM